MRFKRLEGGRVGSKDENSAGIKQRGDDLPKAPLARSSRRSEDSHRERLSKPLRSYVSSPNVEEKRIGASVPARPDSGGVAAPHACSGEM